MASFKRVRGSRRFISRSLIAASLVLLTSASVRAQGPESWGDLFEDSELRSSARSFAARLASPFRPSEEDPLETDRPDFTEASSVVAPGRVQLESGYTFVRDRSGGVETTIHAVPQFVWRIGVVDKVELRIVWDGGYLIERETDQTTGAVTKRSGGTDMDLGTKVALLEQDRWIPETALISTLSVSTGSDEFRSGKTQPKFNLLYSWGITDDWSIAGSSGLGYLFADDDNYTQIHQSFTTAYSITDQWGVYLEWFALWFDGAASGATQHYADTGVTYRFTPNLQLDWRIGVGLNEQADDLFTGAGYSIRW